VCSSTAVSFIRPASSPMHLPEAHHPTTWTRQISSNALKAVNRCGARGTRWYVMPPGCAGRSATVFTISKHRWIDSQVFQMGFDPFVVSAADCHGARAGCAIANGLTVDFDHRNHPPAAAGDECLIQMGYIGQTHGVTPHDNDFRRDSKHNLLRNARQHILPGGTQFAAQNGIKIAAETFQNTAVVGDKQPFV